MLFFLRLVDDYILGDIVFGIFKIVEDCEVDGKYLDDYLLVCFLISCYLLVYFIIFMIFFFCLIVDEINEFFAFFCNFRF